MEADKHAHTARTPDSVTRGWWRQTPATSKQLNQRELSAIKNMHASLGIDVELGLEAGMETSCGLGPPKTSFRHATGFVIDCSRYFMSL